MFAVSAIQRGFRQGSSAAAIVRYNCRAISSSSVVSQASSSGGTPYGGSYENIIAEKREKVGFVTLNRPKALNALNSKLISEINDVTKKFDADPEIGCIVITGSEKAFAAGADIKEMAKKTFQETYTNNMFREWASLSSIGKPIIAGVNGYALGGGCELAMMCDMIIAGDKAKFGQPEITLGTIPGCGGTQRLIRAVGKSKAMEMILSGNMITAEQAEKDGLVCRVVPADQLESAVMELANKIANFSTPVVMMAKETVNAAYEMTLAEGVHFERRVFHSTFATNDQKEGMAAFVQKRKPNFTDS